MCIHSECVRTRQVHKSYRKLTINCIKALHWSSKYSCPELNSLLYVSHSTELLLMCLACQHFDFNSDWFSDDLHMSSTWYLRTIVNEFKHSIQQTLVGQERVTNPWERLRGRLQSYRMPALTYVKLNFTDINSRSTKISVPHCSLANLALKFLMQGML